VTDDSGVVTDIPVRARNRSRSAGMTGHDKPESSVTIGRNDRSRSTRIPNDNALAETINGLYKAKLIHRRAPWKTKESLELATLEWVSWFNHHRLLEPIGYIPPAEAEDSYYRQLASQAVMSV
jgi:hypothetical protein